MDEETKDLIFDIVMAVVILVITLFVWYIREHPEIGAANFAKNLKPPASQADK